MAQLTMHIGTVMGRRGFYLGLHFFWKICVLWFLSTVI